MTTAPEVFEQCQNLLVVHASLHDHVDLDRCQSSLFCSRDALQHLWQFAAIAAHAAECFLIEAVEADGNSLQARIRQFARDWREQRAVGRKRKIVNAGQTPEPFDQTRDPLVEQRFAARQSQFRNTQRNGHRSNSFDFFVAQEFLSLEKLIIRMVFRFRHTVRTSKIASIQYGNSKVAQRPPHAVPGVRAGCRYTIHAVILAPIPVKKRAKVASVRRPG